MATTKNTTAPSKTEKVADKAKQQTSQVKDQAHHVVEQGQQKASQVWELGRTQFHGLLVVQKERAATGIGDLAQVLQHSASQLREQGQAGGSHVAENLAQKLSAISTGVHEKEIEELIADTENFARARPAAFLTVAALIGFILARFLKSSGQTAKAG